MNNRILTVAWGYLGAVIGAGFASGQEIVQFFVIYGHSGLWGTLVTRGLFAVFGVLLASWCHTCGLQNYQSVLWSLFGKRWAATVDALFSMFLFLGICTMLAASGAVFYEHLYLPKQLGIIAACMGVLILLFSGYKGLISSFNLLVPIKVLLLLFVAFLAVFGDRALASAAAPSYVLPSQEGYWLLASVLYVAYNFSLAMVVLVAYQRVATPAENLKGAALGGIVLGIIAAVSFQALERYLPVTLNYQIPMLFVAESISKTAKAVYLVVLWLGILTTALANTYGFAQRFSQFTGLGYPISLVLTVTMAVPLAFQSFAFLVGTIYPLFGVVGVIILATLVVKYCQLKLKSLS